ncbi:MAG TPA: HlyD family efflux transporter periplasmic adaptor subunit [Deltaproteobacteria bacterium]|nr:HlyD family efflux transporter periplasmic adaptor subunit [Deltaproteobacteria bacterium]
MPSRRRRVLLGVGVVLGLAFIAAIIWRHEKRGNPDEIVLYGNIDVREVDVAFNEGDRIVAMYVDEGDRVEAGQLLAELDDSRLEHVVLEAEARVTAQRAVVARFEHGSRPEEIERARAEVAAAEAELADARAVHERQQKLARANVVSKQLADDALSAFLAAEARLKIARENLRLAIEGPRFEDKEAARARLLADENALELARHRLADTKLHAPADAIVLTRILEPGAIVLPNSPAYTLALTDPVWVRAYLTETDLGRVFPGMKAEIRTDSFPDRTYHGWVGFISPTAEFTPKPVETPELRTSLVYRTRIFVDTPDHTLRQGMPVTVHLSLDQEPEEPGTRSTTAAPGATGSGPTRPDTPDPPETTDPRTSQ